MTDSSRVSSRVSPRESTPPAGSRAAHLIDGADFWDAWSVPAAQPELPALDQFLKAVRATPRWVEACMSLRNRVVAQLGLKDLGGLGHIDATASGQSFRVGERVGIFTLFDNTADEAVLGDSDKHLDVRLSVHRLHTPGQPGAVVTITTAVHVKNTLGRLYMLPVKPMHRLIAPAVMRAIARGGPAA